MPWMKLDEPAIMVSGVDTKGTNFGKPAYLHFILVAGVLVCTFIPKLGAKRANILFSALNLAWAFRNFGLITRCEGGVCPEKLAGIYIILITSIVILLTSFFPKEPALKAEKE